jgi:superfamily I DNA and/or RNA helicase
LSRKAATLGLAKSLQERLMLECRYPHIMLNLQYRMKPQIAHFPSSRFYESRLLNGSNVEDPSYGIRGRHNDSSRVLLGGRPYVFLQVAGVEEQGAGGSFRNPAEAQVVVDLLTQLRDDRDKDWMSDNRIRVITYYQAQVALLKRLFRQHNLTDVVVATVDSSQGCESDIVLVSLVRSRASKVAAGTVGFLADDRRMNVSLTRARYQLVCIGNARQLQTCSSETIRQLAIDAYERDCVLPYPSPHTENQSGEGAPLSNSLDLFYGDRKLATKYL